MNLQFSHTTITSPGTAVSQWLRCCATNRRVAGSIPARVSGFFIDTKSFRSHYGPGFHSAFPGGKGGRCVQLTNLPPSCAVVTKSGNLNFLELFGLVQACNGTVLPFHYNFTTFRCLWETRRHPAETASHVQSNLINLIMSGLSRDIRCTDSKSFL